MTNCCVICYRVVSQRNLTDYYADGDNNRLLVLKRFFKLFGRYVDGKGTETRSPQFPLGKVIEIGMTSCEDCLHVMEAFCELYHEWERIELLLRWKVWTVKNLMECAQKVPSRIRDFRERVQNLEKVDDNCVGAEDIVNLVTKSKKSLIKKCSKKVMHGFPKLSIQEWRDPDLLRSPLQNVTQEGICLTHHQSGSIEVDSMLCDGDEMTMKTQLPTTPNVDTSKPNQEVLVLEGDRFSIAGFTDDTTSNEVSLSNIPEKPTEGIGGEAEADHANQLHVTSTSRNDTGDETTNKGQEYRAESECAQQLITSPNILKTAGDPVTPKIGPMQAPVPVNLVINDDIIDDIYIENDVKSTMEPPITDHQNDLAVEKDESLSGDDEPQPTFSASTQITITEIPLSCTQSSTASLPFPDFVEVAATAAKASVSPLKRSLRTVHRCKSCRRTFPSNERLTKHQIDCLAVDDVDDDIENDIPTFDDEETSTAYETSCLLKTEIASGEAAVESDMAGPSEHGSDSLLPDSFQVTEAHSATPKDSFATLKINDEWPPSQQRFLRTVHRCNSCQRTFSSKDRLAKHEVECLVDDDANGEEDGNDTVENEEIGDDYNDTTDTSDDGDSNVDDDFMCEVEDGTNVEYDDIKMSRDELRQTQEKNINQESIKSKVIIRAQNAKCNVDQVSKVTPWQCFTCKLSYKSQRYLSQHVLMKHPAKWKAMKKLGRHKTFQSYLGYSNSKTRHFPGKRKVTHRFSCNDCTLLFTEMHPLLLHRQQRHHAPPPPPPTQTQEHGLRLRTTIVKILCFSSPPPSRGFQRSKDSEVLATLEVPDNGIFSCPKKKCRLPFYSKDDLDEHGKLHGNFQCHFCDSVRKYAPNLAKHELTHVKKIKKDYDDSVDGGEGHSSSSAWECARCSEKFSNRNLYIRHHLAAHMSLTFVGNTCAICSSVNAPSSGRSCLPRLLHHYTVQHDIGAGGDPKAVKRCQVKNCSAYFLSVKRLLGHYKVRHLAEQNQMNDVEMKLRDKFECEDCNQTFTTRPYLRRHRVDHHLDLDSDKLLHCKVDKCQHVFETEKDLEQHIHYRHSAKNMEFIECPKCSKPCNGTSGFKTHMKTHQKSEFRGKRRRRRETAAETSRQYSVYRFKCPDCSHLFLRLPKLLQHWDSSHSLTINVEVNDKIAVEILSFSKAIVPTSLDKAKDFKAFAKIQMPSKIFECPETVCQKLFYSSEDLQTHSKLHGEFKCDFCDVVKDYAPDLSEHEQVNHSVEEKGKTTTASSWNCPRCKLEFTSKEKYLQHHLSSHLSLTLLEQAQCGICRLHKGKLDKIRLLIAHYKQLHDISSSDPTSVKLCPIRRCSAYFLSQRQLKLHITVCHSSAADLIELKEWENNNNKSVPAPVKCKDCDKLYKTELSLRLHRRLLHPEESTRIRCSVPKCTVGCETPEELERHMRYWHPSSSKMDFIECPKCKKFCNGTGLFKRHMKGHETKEQLDGNPTPFMCEICGKGFKAKLLLKQHSGTHAGPESWKFSCGVCPKKCRSKQKLDEHMRTHTKEKPFVCDVCGVKYGHRFNLRIHVNSKHGDAMEDKARVYDKTNLTSRKSVKRRVVYRTPDEDDASLESGSDTD